MRIFGPDSPVPMKCPKSSQRILIEQKPISLFILISVQLLEGLLSMSKNIGIWYILNTDEFYKSRLGSFYIFAWAVMYVSHYVFFL